MIAILTVAGGYVAWRLARAAVRSLQGLPRTNEDMIFF
jgi:hypothetical protein